jgi:Rrf2 family protein
MPNRCPTGLPHPFASPAYPRTGGSTFPHFHVGSATRRYGTRYDQGMRVSTRGDYACRALLSLALHAEDVGPQSVRDIAARTALPQPYLEQILLALKGAGLVRSKRGVGGGYVLARDPELISLADIVSAVDGPIVLGDFGQPHKDGACDHEGQCVLLDVWQSVGDHMRTHLVAHSLAEMVRRAQGKPATIVAFAHAHDDHPHEHTPE